MDKKCPNCGQAIPEEASFCLHCFTVLNLKKLEETTDNAKKSKNKKLIILITAFIILILSIMLSVFIIKGNTTNTVAETSKQDITQSTTHPTNKALTTKLTTKKETTTTAKATEKTTEKPTDKIISSTTLKPETTSTTIETTTKATTSISKTTSKPTTTSAPKVFIDGGTLKNYPANKKNSSYTIPYKVKKISNHAFNNNKYIKTLKFSKREKIDCNWADVFASLPNLKTIYVYPGTDADLIGLQYFNGEIIYYD